MLTSLTYRRRMWPVLLLGCAWTAATHFLPAVAAADPGDKSAAPASKPTATNSKPAAPAAKPAPAAPAARPSAQPGGNGPRADKPTGSAAPAAGDPQPDAHETERRKILASREWRETVHAFNEWLSAQKIYSRSEVTKIRAELNHKVAKMSAQQLRDFLKDTEEKMAILTSKEAEEARTWLAQRMAVEVRATPRELKESRPDVVHMSSAQLEENLKQIEAQRTSIRQTQQGFDSGRQAQIKDIRSEIKEGEKEREESLDRSAASANSPYGNYYQPPYTDLSPGGIPNGAAFGGGAPAFWFGYPY